MVKTLSPLERLILAGADLCFVCPSPFSESVPPVVDWTSSFRILSAAVLRGQLGPEKRRKRNAIDLPHRVVYPFWVPRSMTKVLFLPSRACGPKNDPWRTMKSLLLSLAFGVFGAVAAAAATVTYGTATSQLCVGASGCGVLQQDIGGLRVIYNPVPSSTVTANPSTPASFGDLEIQCIGGTIACTMQSLTGLNLYIFLNQSSPQNLNGSFVSGQITGSVDGFTSTASIAWSSPSITLGSGPNAITYEVVNSPISLNPPEVDFGFSAIPARITSNSNAIPEPSTYAMLATGLAALALASRRRSRP